ncbi:MAG TPA: phosphate acyltransferase PlsX [Thermoanaerobaculia bacterium]|nr:phosphate acyltransferase PlsX [Thermoanaerobaculia bacterium]
MTPSSGRAERMPIVLDAMGGDAAPRDPVRGAVEAARQDGLEVLLVGDTARIEAELAELEVEDEVRRRLELVHAEEVVGMDEPAITPIRKKRRSSLRICAELVREGRSQAMVSAGNTGATMIAAKMVIGVAPGVDRPALAATVPNHDGWTILLDVGANIDTKAEQLRQFAVMGHLYAREIMGVERPRVGLLSIGEEAGKGNEFTREVFGWLEESSLHFIGNVEGGDIFDGTADVVVCDGFVGNVVLKSAEGLAAMIQEMLREEIVKSPLTRLGGGLIKPALLRFRQRTAYDEYGGAPLLGLKAGCFIAHGRSNPKAIHNALRRAHTFVEHRVHERISEKMADLHITAEAVAVEPVASEPA